MITHTGVSVNDLPVPLPHNTMLVCLFCQSEFSATRGDYFWRKADDVFTCCGEPMMLVQKIVRYRKVKVGA